MDKDVAGRCQSFKSANDSLVSIVLTCIVSIFQSWRCHTFASISPPSVYLHDLRLLLALLVSGKPACLAFLKERAAVMNTLE